MVSAPLLREDRAVYTVGRHSDTHLVMGFAVSIILTERNGTTERWLSQRPKQKTSYRRLSRPRKGKSEPKGEKSEYLKVFEQRLTRDCRKLVTDYLAD